MNLNGILNKGIQNLFCVASGIVLVACPFTFAKTQVPLFLFSGQSNMVCLGSTTAELPAEDRNKTYENIKIHNRSDMASQGWSTLASGFGADAQHFGTELYFGKVLSDSMPETKIAFIKDASSGTYLGQSSGWLPPSSGGPGTLYSNMMSHIEKALKEFNDAFDTSLYEPVWAGFIWLQGEFDGWNNQALANKYEENLTNLIKDIRQMAKSDSLPVIIPLISGSMWTYLSTINDAEVAVTQKLTNVDTVGTKGLAFSSDNIHFNAASQIIIGSTSAERWLAMKYWPSTVSVNKMARKSLPVVNTKNMNTASFDLTGRKLSQKSAGLPGTALRNVPGIIINVNGNKVQKKLPVYFK